MRQRPCLSCQALTRNPSRCDTCQAAWQAQHDQQRGSATQRGYDSAWRRTAAQLIANWRAVNGDWCPGYQVEAHPATNLTVDHIVPKARGGTNDPENLRVLCRPCNSRKHDS